LTRACHQVTTAGTVQAALQAASGGVDLLIGDLGLPAGTGHDIMRAVRERYGMCGIAVSRFGMEEDIRRSKAAGFIDQITKPVDLHKIEAALRKVRDKFSRSHGRGLIAPP
jgi:DNA-binding response OmpR family regulator